MNLHLDIAFSHLRSRRRQTIVSLLGVVGLVNLLLGLAQRGHGSALAGVR